MYDGLFNYYVKIETSKFMWDSSDKHLKLFFKRQLQIEVKDFEIDR